MDVRYLMWHEAHLTSFERIAMMSTMYHCTKPELVELILSQGLLPGQEVNYTRAGDWAKDAYGTNPIYLSVQPWTNASRASQPYVTLEVATEGLSLVADLPSLVDHGAYVEPTYEGGFELYWEELAPFSLMDWLDDGAIATNLLLNDPAASAAAIETTGTAACLSPISSDRLRIIAQ